MINLKELIIITICSIIIAFSSALTKSFEINFFLYALLAIFIIILINSLVKKIVAYFFESEIEMDIWSFKKWGYKRGQSFKKGFPAGAFFPLLSKIILFPLSGFVWMASLVFEVKAKVYHAAKRHGMYSFSEMTEWQVGIIAATGIFVNLILAAIFYFIGGEFGMIFAKFNLWFAFFNMLPISNLDGNKIFFGNYVLWSFLAIITLIGLGYTFFLV
jgi:Zn-dependent protease